VWSQVEKRWRAPLRVAVKNDNVVNIWDGRLGDVGEGERGSAKWTKRNHSAQAAFKLLLGAPGSHPYYSLLVEEQMMPL